MSSRIKTAPSLLVAAFLASVVSTATPCVAAGVANDCLNGPKHQAPPGGHWYYRIDRPNNRKCWFVGEEGQRVSQVVAQRPSASSSLPFPRQGVAAIQISLADNEVPMVTTPAEPRQAHGTTNILDPSPVSACKRPAEVEPHR